MINYMTESELVAKLHEEENKIQTAVYRIRSAEAKLERIDPVSYEFDELVNLIERCRTEIAERRVVTLQISQVLDVTYPKLNWKNRA